MQKREAAFQTRFNKWARHNWLKEYPSQSCVFETKSTNKNRLPVSAISDKQLAHLKVGEKIFVHKFSDMGGMGTPLDGVIVVGQGLVILHFGSDAFYIIPVSNWVDWVEQGHKSISEDEARDIGDVHYLK